MDNDHEVRDRVVTTVGIAVAAALVWVVFTTVWLWRHQERIVFQPPALPAADPASMTRLVFAAADGHELYGYVATPPANARAAAGPANARAADATSARTVVVAFHGNADLAAWYAPWARELAARTGAIVFVPEYRGYGGIPGRPTYETAASDAAGALAFARARFAPTRLVLFGHSLGSAIAADVAAAMHPEAPAALVLQSPFTSAREMAARMLVPPIPWLWRRIARVHYDTRTIVARLPCPVSVVHGSRDVVIPTRMGRQVYAAARRPGALLVVGGAGHNDVADLGGEGYWEWLSAAVRARDGASPAVGELEEERHGRLP